MAGAEPGATLFNALTSELLILPLTRQFHLFSPLVPPLPLSQALMTTHTTLFTPPCDCPQLSISSRNCTFRVLGSNVAFSRPAQVSPFRVRRRRHGGGLGKREFLCASNVRNQTGPVGQDGGEGEGNVPAEKLEVGGVMEQGLSPLQTRRFWLGTSLSTILALGGNLGGVTSALLSLSPGNARAVRADLLFPVQGFKRCLETSQGFEFMYPSEWVGDQRLVYRAVERGERERLLELPPIGREARAARRSSDPIVAFGPPGTEGELNVSVVVAPVFPGFSLQKLGEPNDAGELILQKFIAPEGSNKKATLLGAQQRSDASNLYYTLEFTVQSETFFRHNVSVYSTRNNLLFSLNAQCPEEKWPQVRAKFAVIVNSFSLLT